MKLHLLDRETLLHGHVVVTFIGGDPMLLAAATEEYLDAAATHIQQKIIMNNRGGTSAKLDSWLKRLREVHELCGHPPTMHIQLS